MGIIGALVVVFLVTTVVMWLAKMYEKNHRYMDGIQGPTIKPIIGNVHQFRFKPDGKTLKSKFNFLLVNLEFFEQAQGLAYMFHGMKERIVSVWIGFLPFVMVYGAEECEVNTSVLMRTFDSIGYQKMSRKILHKIEAVSS